MKSVKTAGCQGYTFDKLTTKGRGKASNL